MNTNQLGPQRSDGLEKMYKKGKKKIKLIQTIFYLNNNKTIKKLQKKTLVASCSYSGADKQQDISEVSLKVVLNPKTKV